MRATGEWHSGFCPRPLFVLTTTIPPHRSTWAGAGDTTTAVIRGTAANSYNAGYTAGATNAEVSYAMIEIVAVLPGGCITPTVPGGGPYYLCGNTWFSPSYGANGVYYRVVTAP